MKKIILVLSIFLFFNALASDEVYNYFPENSGSILFVPVSEVDIDTKKMKKSEKIEPFKMEAMKKTSKRYMIDVKQYNHERALNYTTRQNNFLPAF